MIRAVNRSPDFLVYSGATLFLGRNLYARLIPMVFSTFVPAHCSFDAVMRWGDGAYARAGSTYCDAGSYRHPGAYSNRSPDVHPRSANAHHSSYRDTATTHTHADPNSSYEYSGSHTGQSGGRVCAAANVAAPTYRYSRADADASTHRYPHPGRPAWPVPIRG